MKRHCRLYKVQDKQLVYVPYHPSFKAKSNIDREKSDLAYEFACDFESVEHIGDEEFELSEVQHNDWYVLGYFWKE